MNILTLRSLVNNGWSISNRKALQSLIGKEELTKLGNAFKKLDECNHLDKTPLRGDIWIPTGSINLSKRDGEFILKFPANLEDIYVKNTTQTFIGKEINLENITEHLKAYQAKIIKYFDNAKELPPSALESKTMKKLYTPEFKASRRINEDGYHVTTLIDKKTGKATEAYVKCIAKNKVLDYENWGIFTKNSQGEYELVGKRSFYLNKDKKRLLPSWMDSEDGSDRFAGIGLRAHQIGVERMMQENLDTVEICAEAQAFPFHYKCGFRVVPMQKEVPQERINSSLDFWAKQSGISKDILEKAIVYKVIDGKKMLDTQTLENWRKLLYLQNNGKFMSGDTPMTLQGEWLEKWKEMAKSYPILLE